MITQKTTCFGLWAIVMFAGCGDSDKNPFLRDATTSADARPSMKDSALGDATSSIQDASSRPRDASSSRDAIVSNDAASTKDAANGDAGANGDAAPGDDASTDGGADTDAGAFDGGTISMRSCGGAIARKCKRSEYCKYSLAAQCGSGGESGQCALRPDACRDVVDPVCGCDGQNYSNACFAAVAGVSVASEGNCPL